MQALPWGVWPLDWLLEWLDLHPGEQMDSLSAMPLFPRTLSTMTLNFLKLCLPVSLGRKQQLLRPVEIGGGAQNNQFSPSCPQLLG